MANMIISHAKNLIDNLDVLKGCRIDNFYSDDNNLWIVMPSNKKDDILPILNQNFKAKFHHSDFAMISPTECEIRYIGKPTLEDDKEPQDIFEQIDKLKFTNDDELILDTAFNCESFSDERYFELALHLAKTNGLNNI